MSETGIQIRPPARPLPEDVRVKLSEAMHECPDVAFAHLVEVEVERSDEAGPVLFVWLRGPALRTLRGALNLVSDTVAGILPEDRFVDVVILNSAPELLLEIEGVDCLLAEPDPQERRRALAAASGELPEHAPQAPRRRWWWPF
jgi:hypothetical protein